MNPASRMKNLRPLACLTVLLSAAPAHAALVAGWTKAGASTSTNLDTASPTVGNGTTDNADNESIYASMATISLTTVGQKVTLSGSATLIGISPNGDAPYSNQFRWGLYNETGTPADTLGWLGYFAGNGSLANGGNLWERTNPNTGAFASITGATLQTTAAAPGTILTGGVAPGVTYSFNLSLERTAAGMQIESSFIRNSDSQQFSLVSFLDTTPQTYDFNRVGFLMGGDLNADQVQFSNIEATLIPEPSAALLGGLGMLLLLRRHRR
jgi:hypothetical protein